MFRAAFLRKVPLFIRNFAENVVLCLAAAGIESTANRFLERLKLTWRSVLTQRVHAQYFAQMVRGPESVLLAMMLSVDPAMCRIGQQLLIQPALWLFAHGALWMPPAAFLSTEQVNLVYFTSVGVNVVLMRGHSHATCVWGCTMNGSFNFRQLRQQ